MKKLFKYLFGKKSKAFKNPKAEAFEKLSPAQQQEVLNNTWGCISFKEPLENWNTDNVQKIETSDLDKMFK